MQTVSLCTYTYNDKELLLGLLQSTASWTIQPDEIIIVDDCSDERLTLDDTPSNCTIVRLDSHMGLRHAKHLGPGLARSEFVLSIDCDTRVTRDWLERCLPHAARKGVGMVSGPVTQCSGPDTVSRYLHYFADNHNVAADGPVDFIPGNARLMRSDTWKKIGGLRGHTMKILEDRYLCGHMKACGYTMYVERNAPVFHVRKLSRTAMAARFFNWNFLEYTKSVPGRLDFPGFVYLDFVIPFVQFYHVAAELNEPLFVYLEFLNMIFSISRLLAYGVHSLDYPAELEASWRRAIRGYLSSYPALRCLLFEDVFKKNPFPCDMAGPSAIDTRWERMFTLLEPFLGPGRIWDWMENVGVALLGQEDATLQHDFSFHLEYEPGQDRIPA